MMNAPDNGKCWANGARNSGYNVPCDSSGNNLLTGDGAGKTDDAKTFTL
jgi:hypothetical protein